MALVALSVVEQRLDAVRAVLAGASVTEVAAAVGVSAHMCVAAPRTGRCASGGDGGPGALAAVDHDGRLWACDG